MKLEVKMVECLSLPGFSLRRGVYRGREGWTHPLKGRNLVFQTSIPPLYTYIPKTHKQPTPLFFVSLGYTYNTYSNYFNMCINDGDNDTYYQYLKRQHELATDIERKPVEIVNEDT